MIALKNIKKSYDGKVIFEDVSITLENGKVAAFVGHNGCGKSTMLKVISGLSGIDGGKIIQDKKYRYAYVPEKFSAYNMTAMSYLRYMASIDGIYSKKEIANRLDGLSKDFFLEDMIKKPMKNLSKGTLQKIGVIQAIMSDADVILLDEPLSGQDVDSQSVFIEKMKQLKEQGKIILLSAHEKELVQALGDMVYTICDHKLIPYEETPKQSYMIWISDNSQAKTSKKHIISNDQLLAYDIRRLQKEGWHIDSVNETD